MFDEIDKLIIKEVQEDMPLTLDPYGDIAKKIGCSKTEVIKRLKKLNENGLMKRIVAILNHRDSGYPENGMLAAVVPKNVLMDAGQKLSVESNVTHCYERKSYDNWPYNLYAMIHGKTRSEVEDTVKKFVTETNIVDYQILYSTKEFKKSSLKYF
jgi:DNA-binding Lrp family transcriptional regulator